VAISHMLNIEQDSDELHDLYGEADYYWYLRSDEFANAFLKPIAGYVEQYGKSCLDVGCGEGRLWDYLTDADYLGFDGSMTAIARGWRRRLICPIQVGRFEDPPINGRSFDVIVLNGILEVLIKPEFRVPFIQHYAKQYHSSHLVVCDLERLDESELQTHFTLLESGHREAVGIELESVKRFRKISVYQL